MFTLFQHTTSINLVRKGNVKKMRKRIKKPLAIILCATLVLASMSACGKSDGEQEQNTVTGRITAISDGEITIAVMKDGKNRADNVSGGAMRGQMPNNGDNQQGAQPGGQSGDQQRPQQSDQQRPQQSDQQRPQQGDGQQSPPQGGMGPDGASGGAMKGNGGFNEETQTIKITDDTEIISNEETKTISDLQLGTMVTITLNDDDEAQTIQIQVMNDKGSSQNASLSNNQSESTVLSGAKEVDEKDEQLSSKSFQSEKADQNTILVSGGKSLTLNDSKLNKTGGSTNVDQSNFTGLNAILAVQENSLATVDNTTFSSSSEGSNALFATGENAVINASRITIKTTGNSSRGLDTTYGGTIKATDCLISTTGAHCACVATDRGGGTITIEKSTLNASGDGSPCIYSTGDISADQVTGKATGSQSMVIEGKNSITLTNSTLQGAGKNGVMLYQSTSGDADEGTCELTVKKSTLSTTSSGPMFYITNTSAILNLERTKLKYNSGILINAAGNSTNNWGTPGSNPGIVTVNASSQTLTGDITCDKISSVSLNLASNSSFKGTIDGDNVGTVNVSLSKDSTWNVAGDSHVSVLTNEDTDLSNISSQGHNVYYDSTQSGNSWIGGKTIRLNGGGKLLPEN